MNRLKTEIIKILLWSQKYTKADMLYIAKGSFWFSLSQTVSVFLSFALLVAFANLLPKETYGTYKYILSIAAVLNIFTLSGMNSAVTRSVAAGNEGAFRHSVRYQLKWNMMMFAAFLFLSGYYFYRGDNTFSMSYLILGLFVPSTMALNTYTSYLVGKKEFRDANIYAMFSALIYTSGVFVTLLLSKHVTWLITAYAASTFLGTLFFYFYTIRKYSPPLLESDSDTLSYGRKLTFISLIGPVVSQIDKIILGHFWGPAQLAIYSLATAVPSRVVPILKKFVSLGSPKFAAKTQEELNSVFYRRILAGMLIGSVATISYIALAPIIFRYLLPQYIEGVFYSQILSVSFIFAMPTRYIGLLFESQKMSFPIFTNTIINSVIAILLYVLLGIFGGIIGLVFAFVLWSFLGMLVNLISWRLFTKKNP